MANTISKYDTLTFTYIQNIYTKLNTERARFSSSAVTLNKSRYDQHTATDITTLQTYIKNMKSNNKYLKNLNIAELNRPATDPKPSVPIKNQTEIQPYFLNEIETIIDRMHGICADNSHNSVCSHHTSIHGYNQTHKSADYSAHKAVGGAYAGCDNCTSYSGNSVQGFGCVVGTSYSSHKT